MGCFSEFKKYLNIVLSKESENQNENDIQKWIANLYDLDDDIIMESLNNKNI